MHRLSHEIRVLVGPVASLRRLAGPCWTGTLYASPWCPDGPALLAVVGDEDEEGYLGWSGSMGRGEDLERTLGQGDQARARDASAGGAIAYLETNYYGSSGYQFAAARVDGALACGPATRWVQDEPPPPPAPPRTGLLHRLWQGRRRRVGVDAEAAGSRAALPPGPINHSLACLGVAPADRRDAFAAYGLGSIRNNHGFASRWTPLSPDSP